MRPRLYQLLALTRCVPHIRMNPTCFVLWPLFGDYPSIFYRSIPTISFFTISHFVYRNLPKFTAFYLRKMIEYEKIQHLAEPSSIGTGEGVQQDDRRIVRHRGDDGKVIMSRPYSIGSRLYPRKHGKAHTCHVFPSFLLCFTRVCLLYSKRTLTTKY